jgi:hypothetical protein
VSGLEFRETMAGSYELLERAPQADRAPLDGVRPMSFTVRVRVPGLLRFARKPIANIEGEVDAQGFADHRPLKGTLEMDVLRKRTLEYAFAFEANDGASYAFEGKKTIVLRELAESMTVLPGEIKTASGKPIARALLRFDLRSDLVRFLRSFRPGR